MRRSRAKKLQKVAISERVFYLYRFIENKWTAFKLSSARSKLTCITNEYREMVQGHAPAVQKNAQKSLFIEGHFVGVDAYIDPSRNKM